MKKREKEKRSLSIKLVTERRLNWIFVYLVIDILLLVYIIFFANRCFFDLARQAVRLRRGPALLEHKLQYLIFLALLRDAEELSKLNSQKRTSDFRKYLV